MGGGGGGVLSGRRGVLSCRVGGNLSGWGGGGEFSLVVGVEISLVVGVGYSFSLSGRWGVFSGREDSLW